MEVGAGFIIRKVFALLRACHMDTATLIGPTIYQKDAGTIRLYLKSISTFNIFPANLTITGIKVSCNTVYVCGCDIQDRSGKTVTTKARTIVTKYLESGTCTLLVHGTTLQTRIF